MIRFLMQTIGYLCVATVLAALLGLAYLWNEGTLSDENVFRLVALVHDVDLEETKAEIQQPREELPPEELSLQEMERYRALHMRNQELKSANLKRNLEELAHRLDQIQELQRRMDNQARSFKELLAEEEAKLVNQGNSEVVDQWEQMKPAQVKDLIMTMRENDEMKDVVLLLGRLDEIRKRKVLSQFNVDNDEEMRAIYEIQALLREGFPKKDLIEQARQQSAELAPGNDQ